MSKSPQTGGVKPFMMCIQVSTPRVVQQRSQESGTSKRLESIVHEATVSHVTNEVSLIINIRQVFMTNDNQQKLHERLCNQNPIFLLLYIIYVTLPHKDSD